MTAMKNELALFHPGARERAVKSVHWVNHRPVSQINNTSAIEFDVSGTQVAYILPSKTRLNVKLRLLKENGEVVEPTDDVSLVNLALHSLFRQVDVSLNQTLITSTVGVNYGYKAMIDALLSYNFDVKESQIQSEGYYKDTAFFMDAASNAGHVQRKLLTKGGVIDFESPLHMDVCQQPKAILNGVQLTVKLFQSGDNFRLFSPSGTKYSVEITDAVLKVCNVTVQPSVLVAQNEMLLKTPAQ